MILRRTVLPYLMALMMAVMPVMLMPAPAAAQPGAGSLTTAIYQALPGGTFAGTLTVTSFAVVKNVLNAIGTITGTFTPAGGGTPTTISGPITIPLTGFTGTCTILTLQTGPINLSVLGLDVSLSPINLVITATAAPGNLLGNLLCAVVHLLDNNGPLTGLTNLLNQILGAIRV